MGEAKRLRARCAYCGEAKTTDDHVPPRNIFTADRTNLITVPACDLHNGKRSGLDERFRDYVSLRVGNDTTTTQVLWERMARGVRKNRKRREAFIRNSFWHPEFDAYEVKIESDAFKPMIEWITRGLYWHVYKGQRLPLDIQMEVHEMRIGEWLPGFISDMARAIIGKDQFLYACKRMDEHPSVSVWLYIFHRRLVAMAMTDRALADKIIAEYENKQR